MSVPPPKHRKRLIAKTKDLDTPQNFNIADDETPCLSKSQIKKLRQSDRKDARAKQAQAMQGKKNR